MRIGIDCRTILNPKGGEKAGIAHYTYYLVKNLLKIDKKNQYVLFFDSAFMDVKEFRQKNVTIKFFPFSQYRRYLPFAYSHVLITAMLVKEKLDVYHNPAGVIPLSYRGRSVVTVHDLAIYKNPQWFPQRLISRNAFYTKVLIPSSIKRAEKILAVSENTKKDLVKMFKVKAKKIIVTPLGVAKEKISNQQAKKVLKRFKLTQPYILYLGTIEPRKNIIMLIHAFEQLVMKNKKFKDLNLVLAGARGWKFQGVFKALEASYVKEGIKYLNYVSHEEKLALISKAQCFVFPTLYEGFGLPVLEAMSLGTPVITSKVASLPEVVDDAGILINPNKEKELEEALAKILGSINLQKKIAQKGITRAKIFNWQTTAKQTLEVYQSLPRTPLKMLSPKRC